MKKIIYGVCIIFFLQPVFAENVTLDVSEIQTWRGLTGKWVELASLSDLNTVAEKYGTTTEEIRRANGDTLNPRSYIFIPYSENYLSMLRERGIDRAITSSSSSDYIWPLVYVDKITSSFGYRGGELHTGVDLPSPQGTPVLASRDGRVVFAGYCGGHGKSIVLEHRDNFFTRYSHNSVMLVKKGDLVCKGQVIGFVGSTGRSTGNHLHFEIRYGEIPLDPVDFLPVKDDIVQAHNFFQNRSGSGR